MRIHVIALSALGQGLSGGDRIFIEFSRRWAKRFPLTLYVWEEGLAMCARENLTVKDISIQLIKVGKIAELGFIATYIFRILLGIKMGFTLKVTPGDLVYSASEFWMDSLPAFILRIRSKVLWVAAWYQTAPAPWTGFFGGRYKFSALLYWLAQLPIKPLITRKADVVLINNTSEKKQFVSYAKLKVVVVIGAVDTDRINNYLSKHAIQKTKTYLAVFQGRFHPQKGVVELIRIWQRVVKKLPSARLCMIGDGPLKSEVVAAIHATGLEKNVDLLGYISDGDKKYKLFSTSKLVVHPALYDSGGMASAEAMAFGLPCVAFDLEAYASYYPKGLLKVPVNNLTLFSDKIIELATNMTLYKTISTEARDLIQTGWSWDQRAKETLDTILAQ